MLNHNDIYIASCASWLPENFFPVEKALLEGKYEDKDAKDTAYHSVAVASDNLYPSEMASCAAKLALKSAGIKGDELASVIYNAIHRHGNPQLWCPASYLQSELAAVDAIPLTINQGCNSQLLSIDVMRKILLGHDKNYALAVAADKFSGSSFDRWRSDYGIVYGDAASAVVLSKVSGIAKILSLENHFDPELESLHRLSTEYDEQSSNYQELHYLVRLSKKKFMEQYGSEMVMESTRNAMKMLHAKTFESKRISPDSIKYFIFPNLGKKILDENYFFISPMAEERSLWEFGRKVGHLGAGDCITGLTHLIEHKKLSRGDRILCIGAGSGFSLTFFFNILSEIA